MGYELKVTGCGCELRVRSGELRVMGVTSGEWRVAGCEFRVMGYV